MQMNDSGLASTVIIYGAHICTADLRNHVSEEHAQATQHQAVFVGVEGCKMDAE